jgi:hypothetical protein
MSDLRDLPAVEKARANLPLTMEEAAPLLFQVDYLTLKNNLRTLMAQDCPFHKVGRRYVIFPRQFEAWCNSRLNPQARRALRLGGYECSDAERMASRTATGTADTR